MSAPDWLGLGAALLTLLTVAELLRRGILRERFAALWLAVAVVLVFLAVFPQALRWAADLLHDVVLEHREFRRPEHRAHVPALAPLSPHARRLVRIA